MPTARKGLETEDWSERHLLSPESFSPQSCFLKIRLRSKLQDVDVFLTTIVIGDGVNEIGHKTKVAAEVPVQAERRVCFPAAGDRIIVQIEAAQTKRELERAGPALRGHAPEAAAADAIVARLPLR